MPDAPSYPFFGRPHAGLESGNNLSCLNALSPLRRQKCAPFRCLEPCGAAQRGRVFAGSQRIRIAYSAAGFTGLAMWSFMPAARARQQSADAELALGQPLPNLFAAERSGHDRLDAALVRRAEQVEALLCPSCAHPSAVQLDLGRFDCAGCIASRWRACSKPVTRCKLLRPLPTNVGIPAARFQSQTRPLDLPNAPWRQHAMRGSPAGVACEAENVVTCWARSAHRSTRVVLWFVPTGCSD